MVVELHIKALLEGFRSILPDNKIKRYDSILQKHGISISLPKYQYESLSIATSIKRKMEQEGRTIPRLLEMKAFELAITFGVWKSTYTHKPVVEVLTNLSENYSIKNRMNNDSGESLNTVDPVARLEPVGPGQQKSASSGNLGMPLTSSSEKPFGKYDMPEISLDELEPGEIRGRINVLLDQLVVRAQRQNAPQPEKV